MAGRLSANKGRGYPKARTKNPQLRVPDYLSIYERGGGLHAYQKTALDNLVKGVSARVGIGFSNHTLRRTYGRTLWEMNKRYPGACPIETIAALMGHRDIRTTIIYLGIDLQDKADAMNRLKEFQVWLQKTQNPFPSSISEGSGQSGI